MNSRALDKSSNLTVTEEAGKKQVAGFPLLPVVLAVLTSYGLLALLVLSLRSWLSNRGNSIAPCCESWPGRASWWRGWADPLHLQRQEPSHQQPKHHGPVYTIEET